MEQKTKALEAFITMGSLYELAVSHGFKIVNWGDHIEVFPPFSGSTRGTKVTTDEEFAEFVQIVHEHGEYGVYGRF